MIPVTLAPSFCTAAVKRLAQETKHAADLESTAKRYVYCKVDM